MVEVVEMDAVEVDIAVEAEEEVEGDSLVLNVLVQDSSNTKMRVTIAGNQAISLANVNPLSILMVSHWALLRNGRRMAIRVIDAAETIIT